MDMSNAAFAATDSFVAACAKAGVEPTAAQASKYRRGFGIAYTTEHGLAVGSRAQMKMRTMDEGDEKKRPAKPQQYGPYSGNPNGKK